MGCLGQLIPLLRRRLSLLDFWSFTVIDHMTASPPPPPPTPRLPPPGRLQLCSLCGAASFPPGCMAALTLAFNVASCFCSSANPMYGPISGAESWLCHDPQRSDTPACWRHWKSPLELPVFVHTTLRVCLWATVPSRGLRTYMQQNRRGGVLIRPQKDHHIALTTGRMRTSGAQKGGVMGMGARRPQCHGGCRPCTARTVPPAECRPPGAEAVLRDIAPGLEPQGTRWLAVPTCNRGHGCTQPHTP